MSGPVLVVAAHPDDEALGCGGAMARHAAEGRRVEVLFVADGVGARGPDDAALARRRAAAREAARILGASPPRFLDFPDNRLDGVDLLDVVRAVEAAVREVGPRLVYTHHGGDLNVDHGVVHRAVLTACRPLPGSGVDGILAFETPSSTEWSSAAVGPAFAPTMFTDVAAHLDAKAAALAAYGEEMRAFPHPRSETAVRALAAVRGAAAGLEAAEAFEVVRWIGR